MNTIERRGQKMKKKEIFKCAAFCFTMFFLVVPEICVGDDGMEVLNYRFEIDAGPRHGGGVDIQHNPIENEFMGVWSTSGILRDDCEPGDEYECTNSFKAVEARRISRDGELLGDSIQLSPPELLSKSFVGVANNPFANEYLVGYTEARDSTAGSEMHIARMNSVGDLQLGPMSLYPSTSDAGHTEIVFNPARQEYLVAYNDRNVFNEYNNNVGFILDEHGNAIEGPFPIGDPDALLVNAGAFYAPRCDYNSTNDTYLCVWEDFRNPGWDIYAPCDVYGSLHEANGDMITEIPVLDDAGVPDEGNQRVPVPIYNPDKNEFLVLYKDEPAGTAGAEGWIMGRIVDADGSLPGDAFLVEDHPRLQHWPDAVYVEEEGKYFMVWNDLRNDGLPPGTPFWLSGDIDVYGRWLDDSGMPVGDEVVIADSEDWQMSPAIAYNPVMRRFLIAWRDRNAPGDYEPIPPPPGTMMGGDSPNDIRGTIYGVPSFCSARIIERGTGNPVEGAQVLVIGRGLLERERTNVGGWCNLPKDSQRNGTYFMIAWKGGHGMAMRSVRYEGEPLQATIELR
jgi:hypothetical protein